MKIKILIIVLVMIMAVLIKFKYETMSFLKKIGIEYYPCVEDVCVSLNKDWVVMYNDASLLGKVITMWASPKKNVLYLFHKSEENSKFISAMIFKFDPEAMKLNSEMIVNTKVYDWGNVKVLSSNVVSEPDDKIRVVNEEYGLFIVIDNMQFLDDIEGVYLNTY